MSSPYIPNRDGDLATWATNFSTLITAAPGTYGLVAADATTISTAVTTYTTALAVATNFATRGPSSIAAKDVAKQQMLDTIRPYAQNISRNAGVTTQHKIDIGVNPRTNTPTPIPAPSTSPLIAVIAATPFQHTLRFSDQNSPDSRSKPFGALSLEVRCLVGVTPPTSPTDAPFIGLATKNPYAVNFSMGDVGHTAYYYARWVTRRGLVGPWSTLKTFTVAA